MLGDRVKTRTANDNERPEMPGGDGKRKGKGKGGMKGDMPPNGPPTAKGGPPFSQAKGAGNPSTGGGM